MHKDRIRIYWGVGRLAIPDIKLRIVNCKLCPRLINYIEEVGKQHTQKSMNQVH